MEPACTLACAGGMMPLMASAALEASTTTAVLVARSEERRVGKECRARVVLSAFQAEDGIRDHCVTGVQTCALPILGGVHRADRIEPNPVASITGTVRNAHDGNGTRLYIGMRRRNDAIDGQCRARGFNNHGGAGREIGRASCRERV